MHPLLLSTSLLLSSLPFLTTAFPFPDSAPTLLPRFLSALNCSNDVDLTKKCHSASVTLLGCDKAPDAGKECDVCTCIDGVSTDWLVALGSLPAGPPPAPPSIPAPNPPEREFSCISPLVEENCLKAGAQCGTDGATLDTPGLPAECVVPNDDARSRIPINDAPNCACKIVDPSAVENGFREDSHGFNPR